MRANAKVLIVDDEEGVRQVISLFFQKNGCQVSTARDGQDGIEKVRQEQFDLVVLDLKMPRMTGMEALPIIRELNPEARVVIMTGFGSYESKVEAREKGAYDYLLKPVDLAKIKEVADRALPDRRQVETGTGLTRMRLTSGKVNPDVVQMIPERVARVFCLIAVACDADGLTVAMADPSDVVALDTLSAQTGLRIRPVLADKYEIVKALEEAYRMPQSVEQPQIDAIAVPAMEPESIDAMTVLSVEPKPEPVQPEAPVMSVTVDTDETTAEGWVNRLLVEAVQRRASAIHIELEEQSASVRLRVNERMHEAVPPSKDLLFPVVSRIKTLARMDDLDHRLPQDGWAHLRLEQTEIEVRVNTVPTIHGESLVIRLRDEPPLFTDLKGLGLDDRSLPLVLDAIQRPHGMVYVTGPTGSGKTTTLYSVLHFLNSRERKIITVEEPVEYDMPGITQVRVRSDRGLTFASTLRAVLRQDPDVIMVGETRDVETAEVALQAAATGPFVCSTLSMPDSPSCLTRLADLGVPPPLLSSALTLIIAQRLVRRLCPECKTVTTPSPELVERAKAFSNRTLPEQLYTGAGCEQCHRTGYRGRVAIHELLPITGQIRQVILDGAEDAPLRSAAKAMGCATLLENGLAKAAQGLTTLDELLF